MYPRTRALPAALAVATTLMSGCAIGGDSAHTLAVQACDLAQPNNTLIGTSRGTSGTITLSDLRASALDYEEAVSLASRAAAADRSYERLAEPITTLASIASALVELVETNGTDSANWSAPARATLSGLAERWDDAEGVAYAQCAIVTAE